MNVTASGGTTPCSGTGTTLRTAGTYTFYVTDANGSGLTMIDVPADDNVIATYGGAAIKTSTAAALAAEFLVWLRGADAQAMLAAHGFGTAP